MGCEIVIFGITRILGGILRQSVFLTYNNPVSEKKFTLSGSHTDRRVEYRSAMDT